LLLKNNDLLEDYINFFVKIGGFDLLFKHLRNGNEIPCSLPVMNTLVSTISALRMNYLSQEVIEKCVNQLQGAVSSRLTKLNESDLRSGSKEDFNKAINGILEKMFYLMEKVVSPTAVRNFISDIALKIALQCFQSCIFDKRIYGLTFITNLVTSLRPAAAGMGVSGGITFNAAELLSTSIMTKEPLVDEKTLTTWLLDNKILPSIFGASRHTEIIRRSGPILEILARQDVVTDEDLSLCLDCIVKAHSSVATKVLELLAGAAVAFLPHHVDFLLAFFHTFRAR